jgi:hypothetical protein
MRNLILSFLLLIPAWVFAQNGIIRGEIFEQATGEPLPFVVVQAEGANATAISDLDGKFELQVPAGKYTIKFTLVSFGPVSVPDIEVTEGQVTVMGQVAMSDEAIAIKEVEVKAEFKRNTENSLLTVKAKSANMIDGVSSATFRKTGDGDVASAAKRVPGISVAGGKYVFVRGIGDRYNKTVLNGVDIPGLDPDRNTLQMDIFPTSIIENMIVNKTFVAELPADFTGGIINLELKSFPEEKNGSISLNAGYNPNFHFNSNYTYYKGGKLDFLGIDDGTRAIPATGNIPLFADVVGNVDGPKAIRYKEILNSFSKTMAAEHKTSLMDFGLSASYGNQVKKGKNAIGYNFLLNYSNQTEYYKDIEYGEYGLAGDSSVFQMNQRINQKGELGVNNVMLSGMAGFAVKSARNKFTFNALHIQNGESSAGIFSYISRDEGADYDAFQHNLTYSQRSLSNLFISGKHLIGDKGWNMEWKVAPTYSTIEDPDFRIARYQVFDSTDLVTIGTESGFPERIWRNLNEFNVAATAAFSKEYKIKERKATLLFGGANTFKARDYVIRNFALNIRGSLPLTGDPNELMSEEFLWPYNGDITQGTTYEAPFIPTNPNQFNSNINNAAAYVANDMMLNDKLRMILGLRTEYYVHRYTGRDQLGTRVFNNEKVLENLGIFPSLNLVYAATEKQNFRFAYGRTVARPSFKELSFAEIYDPVTGRTFIGGLFKDSVDVDKVYWDGNLRSTDIHNLDLRWEIFPAPGRTVSVSAFFKYFIDPIEIIQYAVQNGSFQPRNVGDGQVIGGEFEIRENMKFIGEKWEPFDLVLNVTLVSSRIALSNIEYESRVLNARVGQEISETRRMAGQAPYIINGGFLYNGGKEKFLKGFEVGAFYNVQGPTLEIVGIVDRPDIYTVPFHSLNLSVSKQFGKNGNQRIAVRATNLLNDKKESIYRSYKSDDQYFTRIAPGTLINVKYTLTF